MVLDPNLLEMEIEIFSWPLAVFHSRAYLRDMLPELVLLAVAFCPRLIVGRSVVHF